MLVERHYIKGTKDIKQLCQLSKQLYNKCNYLMRQAWLDKQRLPDVGILINAVHELDCFKQLHNTKTAKQTIWQCLTDWSNFKKARNAYFKDKSKFVKCPKPPHYKKELAQVIFYNETIRKKPLKSGIITPTNDCFKIKSDKIFKQVVITPKSFGFIVEVQYKKEKHKTKLDKTKFCCIDIGLNNLATITQDQHQPLLVNGRIVKSINQWYNKNKSKTASKKRYFRLENYFHHVSKFIIENCKQNNIGRIVIGKNDGWKTGINLGKRTNQAFCSVPYYKLFLKINYKAQREGIDVIYVEESYTSQSSFFDNDPLPIYDKKANHPKFSGNRKCRGLYVCGDGYAVNADVNGSLNIGRKVIPECVAKQRIGDRSLSARPVRVNPLKSFMPVVRDQMEVVDDSNFCCL